MAFNMSRFVTMPSHVLPSSFVAPSLQVSSSPCSWPMRPSPCTRCHLSPSSSSKPLLGSHDYSLLKSLTLSPHVVNSEADGSTRRMKEVKERTREAFYRAWDSRAAMEMVDHILFTTALRFRLLRQNGFPTHSDVFGKFMDKNGKFKESLTEDIWGMLSLHEASHLGAKNEEVLAEAKEFTRIHLIQSMPYMEPHFSSHVGRALELPRHLRMARLEARNYIDEYSRESNPNSVLLELAKLDFDMVQSLHQKELAEIVRWWKQLGLVDKLDFARDRPMECFLWTVGIFPDPRHSSCRIELTKAIAILLVIDDIYDSYGSLDELALFTDAVKRWDLGAMDQLPEYMKICYMALYNTTNDIAYRILKEHGWSVIEDLKRTWMDIFGAFLAEAYCFKGGHVPSLEEYLTNAVTTGGTYMALVHAFFLMGQGVTRENMAMLKPYPNIFSCSGKILRLWDDLGTAREEQERGDNASSIECYKREREREMDTVLEDEACRKHIRQMIQSLWVELNGELVASSALPLSIIKAAFNLSRTAQVIYQHGDDNKTSSVEDHVQALLFRPVSSNGHAQITMH
ncbi:putative terpene synthase 11 [Vitis vinifera]|uniref:Putative terpene synthase 11 n=1 Tax=Vitis vinifera TaxID=29760 RepID=A0A438GJY0_VITVI|nr:putative terpene synthase 11 [Vitis vinifera]